MKNSIKKKITYFAALIYIVIPAGMILFHIGEGTSSINPIVDAVLLLFWIPVSFIIVFFGFLCGKTGAIFGTIITMGLAIFLIERFFKKPNSS